jgi:type IV fimbrial biogenesis protein FimT
MTMLRYQSQQTDQSAFTLIEMMIVVSLSLVILALGVPSFIDTIKAKRIETRAELAYHFLKFARSEAVKRRAYVVICKTTQGTFCAHDHDWSNGGWLVFEDLDRDAEIDEDETILRASDADAHTPLTIEVSKLIRDYVAFSPTGAARRPNGDPQSGVMVMCDSQGTHDQAAAVRLAPSGQVTFAKVDDAEHIACSAH